MTLQDELAGILKEIREYRWTPELFQRVNDALNYTNVFRFLKANLLQVEYEQFDMEYCEHFRPGQKELAKYIKTRREKGKQSKNQTAERKEVMKPRTTQKKTEQKKQGLKREFVASQILKW